MKPIIITKERQAEFNALKAEFDNVWAEMQRLSQAHDAGKITSAEWTQKILPLQDRAIEIQQTLLKFNG